MKKSRLLAVALLVCASATAASAADMEALRSYAKKAMVLCPGGIVTVEKAPSQGPSNFELYVTSVTSSDDTCATKRYLLYSPVTQQVLIGTVVLLPSGAEPVATRVAAHASNVMRAKMTATISPFPLPDGLRAIALTKTTPYGPFSYNGFIDASERFLIIASRGNLRTDPGRSLRDSLQLEKGVKRGNAAAKVQIVELSDFECPTCARAHAEVEPIIAKNLSKVNYIRLDLPLFEHHEWAVPAALAAHAIQKVAPSKYWDFVDYVFKNQEDVAKVKFDKFFQDYCEDHDISWAKASKIYRSTAERQAIMEGVSRAFDNGIASTPTFIINGQVMGFGPSGGFVVQQIKNALGVK